MPPAAPKRENLLLNLVCNIALPTVILMKLSDENRLGPNGGMLLALIFPLGYGIYDLMLVADLDGKIIAANTVDSTGKLLDTSRLIGRSVKGEAWFDECHSAR